LTARISAFTTCCSTPAAVKRAVIVHDLLSNNGDDDAALISIWLMGFYVLIPLACAAWRRFVEKRWNRFDRLVSGHGGEEDAAAAFARRMRKF
jgi:hypothetical protein